MTTDRPTRKAFRAEDTPPELMEQLRAAIAIEAATAGETEGLDPKDESAGRRHRTGDSA